MENAAIHEVAYLEKYLTVLATITNIAPLLGFLGTVVGMILSFEIIAAARPEQPGPGGQGHLGGPADHGLRPDRRLRDPAVLQLLHEQGRDLHARRSRPRPTSCSRPSTRWTACGMPTKA